MKTLNNSKNYFQNRMALGFLMRVLALFFTSLSVRSEAISRWVGGIGYKDKPYRGYGNEDKRSFLSIFRYEFLIDRA